MAKRSTGTFERRPQDAYDTPYSAALELLPHVPNGARFYEPCAGAYKLASHLESLGLRCTGATDSVPRDPRVRHKDACKIDGIDLAGAEFIITNPPWQRSVLHPMIEHFRLIAPAWLLLDADYAHTKQAAPYMEYCSKIVAIGRVKWIEGSKHTGKDNVAWYCFERKPCITEFYARNTNPIIIGE